MATLRLTCDGEALARNWRSLDRMSGAARAGAAVKADGYGLGAMPVTRRLLAEGCRDFFVAHWGEAAELQPLMTDGARLSVLHGLTSADGAPIPGVKPVLNTPGQVRRWKESGGGLCDVMIDTGINRLGLSPADVAAGLCDGLDIDICMSHLASADEDSAQNTAQLAAFQAIRGALAARRYSLANSAGIGLGTDYHFDLTRPGISLYGGVMRDGMAASIATVATPEAVILQLHDIAAGDAVGYGATFVADRPMRTATVSLGYADGYQRSLSGKGRFRAGEALLPVLGRVSMDLSCIDLTAAPDLKEGDWVAADFDLPAASAASGIAQYELLTHLGHRFERRWVG